MPVEMTLAPLKGTGLDRSAHSYVISACRICMQTTSKQGQFLLCYHAGLAVMSRMQSRFMRLEGSQAPPEYMNVPCSMGLQSHQNPNPAASLYPTSHSQERWHRSAEFVGRRREGVDPVGGLPAQRHRQHSARRWRRRTDSPCSWQTCIPSPPTGRLGTNDTGPHLPVTQGS